MQGYDQNWKPIEAKWYHRLFLWVLKKREARELDWVYYYKVLFGRAYFYKTVYVEPVEPKTRAGRRERARMRRQVFIHNKGEQRFELMTKAEAEARTPSLFTKEKIKEIINKQHE